MDNGFHFAKLTNIETQTFDNTLEHFHSMGIEGTVRENLQNSIDARLLDTDEIARIHIHLDEIEKNQIPSIEQIEEHIHSLIGGNSYTKETIAHMKEAISMGTVRILTFEDEYTKGLSLEKKQYSDYSTYETFAYTKGIHISEDDNQLEIVRGGSHGVGKIANNAASDIHLMFFANCDKYNQKNIGGTIQLIEHRCKNDYFRSTGYYAQWEKNGYRAYENTTYSQIFQKNSRGLKIIIPFLKEEYADREKIIRAVCDNFFVSILDKKVEVIVSEQEYCQKINSETVLDIIKDKQFYPENCFNKNEIKKIFTPLYIQTFIEKGPIDISLSVNDKSYHFKFFYQIDEDIKLARIGIIRSIGMKIVDFKLKNYVRKPFNGVLIGGAIEDEYLKKLENEAHTDLSADAIRDKKQKREARKFIRELTKELIYFLEKELNDLYPSNGKINTADLIYEQNKAFISTLADNYSEKVELINGKSIRKKKIQERRSAPENSGRKGKDTGDNHRQPRKLKVKDDEVSQNDSYIIPAESVFRMDFLDLERVEIDLTTIEQTIEQVNLSYRVIDGDGREYDHEFDLMEYYSSIEDGAAEKNYNYDSFTIYSVEVKNNILNLQFNKRNLGMNPLKFIYRLEVVK